MWHIAFYLFCSLIYSYGSPDLGAICHWHCKFSLHNEHSVRGCPHFSRGLKSMTGPPRMWVPTSSAHGAHTRCGNAPSHTGSSVELGLQFPIPGWPALCEWMPPLSCLYLTCRPEQPPCPDMDMSSPSDTLAAMWDWPPLGCGFLLLWLWHQQELLRPYQCLPRALTPMAGCPSPVTFSLLFFGCDFKTKPSTPKGVFLTYPSCETPSPLLLPLLRPEACLVLPSS